PAAIDRDLRARDVGRLVGTEKYADVGDLGRLADPLQRHPAIAPVPLRALLSLRVAHHRVDAARVHRIDPNAVRPKFHRRALGEAADGPFAGRIGAYRVDAAKAVDRRDVD